MGRGIELGNDDGLGEWRARLTSETFRIKKIFCLPENLAEYHSAALKILMNRSGTGPLDVTIKLNEHQLPVSDQVFPDLPEWHEIPVELTLLQGQTKITVYIRTQASAPGTYLQIWGDQDTPNTQSVFNFGQTDDLSPDEGKQTGEYLIRLVLRK